MGNCLRLGILLCIFLSKLSFVVASEEKKVIKIGTGNILRGYYQIGLKLCDFISKSNNITCYAVPTQGSVENIKLLRGGQIDFALVQANIALDAATGTGYYSNAQPMQELKEVLRLHDEIFTVIVKDENKIKIFGDIEGRKITNGASFSGSTITYNELRKFYSFAKEPEDIELDDEQYGRELCAGKVDALMLMVGHPNVFVSHITNSCNVEFVPIERDKIVKLINSNKSFHQATLSKAFYPDISNEQATIAVSAILVTTDKTAPKVVGNFLKYFHQNIRNFKHVDPLLSNLSNEHFTSNFILPTLDISKDSK